MKDSRSSEIDPTPWAVGLSTKGMHFSGPGDVSYIKLVY